MTLSNHTRNMFQCSALGALLEDGSMEHGSGSGVLLML